jgi:hypothetical protein
MVTMLLLKMCSVLWMGFTWRHMEHIMHMTLKHISQISLNFTCFNGWMFLVLGCSNIETCVEPPAET